MQNAFLVVINISPNEWKAAITQEEQIIGRGKDADILVQKSNSSVSRKHAKIWLDRNIWIEDLGSTYGTRVNGVKIAPNRPTVVDLNDRLMLGLVEFVLVDERGLAAREFNEKGSTEDSHGDVHMSSVYHSALVENQLPVATLAQLSNAERDVVMWLMRGVTEAEGIGKRLGRSVNTVRTHLNNIFRKLGVHSRHELMAQLLRHGNNDMPTHKGQGEN